MTATTRVGLALLPMALGEGRRLYESEYGLTELRLYTTAFMKYFMG